MKNNIFVTFQKEGIHCFPEAASDSKYATGDKYDVSFLAHPHRHMFHFRVEVSVSHDNRDIEFIQFKRWLENLYNQETLALDNKSCEMIAKELATKILCNYVNLTMLSVEISEDGENGAVLELDQKDIYDFFMHEKAL